MEDTGQGIVQGMLDGYGKGFPRLEELFGIRLTQDDLSIMELPIPALNRYRKNVLCLGDITSHKAVGLFRFYVITEYFIALYHELSQYQGPHRKVIQALTPDDIAVIRSIGNKPEEIVMAERIERFTDHDTAAATDYVKLRIATLLPHLSSSIEGVHFANTSEDVMGNVFGLIADKLVYDCFLKALLGFCLFLIDYRNQWEHDKKSLIIPAMTHEQAAEPTTLGKKFANRLYAIDYLVQQMLDPLNGFKPFSGLLSGAVGNLTCHYAAYPSIDWVRFAKRFVEGLGLKYEYMTDQCVSYAVEAQSFATIANILTQVVKLTDDFIKMARCPAQFFVKQKKEGQKGSSIMPNKSNAWAMEGAIKMLKEAQSLLWFLVRELPSYPDEGNMGRSYLFRNVGMAFMPIFIGLGRIEREMQSYVPNLPKIIAFIKEYPGMAGSSLQTVLKREGIKGDAYRVIQEISINPDGTYANSKQFQDRLKEKMDMLELPGRLREELMGLLDPTTLVGPAHTMACSELTRLQAKFTGYKELIEA